MTPEEVEAIKDRVNGIVIDALSGRVERYIHRQAGEKYTKWGLVSDDIRAALDEALSGVLSPSLAAPHGERERALEAVEQAAYAMYSAICVGGVLTLDSPEVKQYEAASNVLWKDELADAVSPSPPEAVAAARDIMARLRSAEPSTWYCDFCTEDMPADAPRYVGPWDTAEGEHLPETQACATCVEHFLPETAATFALSAPSASPTSTSSTDAGGEE